MNRAVLILAASYLFAVSSASSQSIETVSLTVLDKADDMPLADARVTISQFGQVLGVTRTNSDGLAVLEGISVGVEQLPSSISQIGEPYPNPTAGNYNISFELDRAYTVRVSVVDLLGRVIVESRFERNAGRHTIATSLSGVPTGVYLTVIQAGPNAPIAKRIVLVAPTAGKPGILITGAAREGAIRIAKISGVSGTVSVLVERNGFTRYEGEITVPGTSDVVVKLESGVESMISGSGMNFVRLIGGTYRMGLDLYFRMSPAHDVTITRDFFISTYEVSQEQYESLLGEAQSQWENDPLNPVERRTWEDAWKFANAMSTADGLPLCYSDAGETVNSTIYDCEGYRLPTEAEWEYAARAGSLDVYSFGNNESLLDDYGWYDQNSNGQTHPIGQKLPNKWGLFDMEGNVWEWMHDEYVDWTSADPVTDPVGVSTIIFEHVVRSGSYSHAAFYCRVVERGWQVGRTPDQGIRLARTAH